MEVVPGDLPGDEGAPGEEPLHQPHTAAHTLEHPYTFLFNSHVYRMCAQIFAWDVLFEKLLQFSACLWSVGEQPGQPQIQPQSVFGLC